MSWEIKAAANGERTELPPGYRLCSGAAAGLEFGRRKKGKLVKKEIKVRGGTKDAYPPLADPQKEASAPRLITAELMKGRQRRGEKIPPSPTWEEAERSTTFPQTQSGA